MKCAMRLRSEAHTVNEKLHLHWITMRAMVDVCFCFFSSRRRHTRLQGDWSSDVCSSDLGIAMSHWYPLWYPPSPAALKAGSDAIAKAIAAPTKTERETDYIAAIAAFYRDSDKDRKSVV